MYEMNDVYSTIYNTTPDSVRIKKQIKRNSDIYKTLIKQLKLKKMVENGVLIIL